MEQILHFIVYPPIQRDRARDGYRNAVGAWKGTTPKRSQFHIYLPATEPHTHLCYSTLSARVNGYPTPTLGNWGYRGKIDGKSVKIIGFSDWLNGLDNTHDDDLVLLIDAYDIWFQLRPEVMINRYYDMIDAANSRARKRYKNVPELRNVETKVIFSAQKEWWPYEPWDPPTYVVPYSTLPSDFYGPDTDTVGIGEATWQKIRARWLNSGTIIGPVKDLRDIFARARKLLMDPKAKYPGMDQQVVAQIFGEQEYVREAKLASHPTIPQRLGFWWPEGEPPRVSVPDFHRTVYNLSATARYEYGMSLDYTGLLAPPTVSAEDDAVWLRHNDTSTFLGADVLGLPADHSHYPPSTRTHLAQDILRSRPPFADVRKQKSSSSRSSSSDRDSDSKSLHWMTVPLFTNLYSGIVPTMIHQNTHRYKGRLRDDTWNQMWFYPYARDLFTAAVTAPDEPVAVTRRGGETREWWSAYPEKGGVKTAEGLWVPWSRICNTTLFDFHDGQGEWISPQKGG
ncbi:MAG: hypothetical protein Q9157_003994 [Trypethelium eluteriae]